MGVQRSETIVNSIFHLCHRVRSNCKQFMPFSWTGKTVCMFALKQTVERLSTFCHKCVRTRVTARGSRLCKTESINTDLLKALLGNSSVNTFQHATMGAVLSVDECYTLLLGAQQFWLQKEVFSMWSMLRNSRSVFYVVRTVSI
jgi:molybdenum cofactor biosynthesis enzyme MoaA